jgi:hypothetical protein
MKLNDNPHWMTAVIKNGAISVAPMVPALASKGDGTADGQKAVFVYVGGHVSLPFL